MNKSSLQFFNRCTTRELKMEKHKGPGAGPSLWTAVSEDCRSPHLGPLLQASPTASPQTEPMWPLWASLCWLDTPQQSPREL